jgi:hypothetical protein
MALGFEVIGGLVFGWDAHGLVAAGYSGRGLIDAWIAHPDPSAAPEPTVPVLPGALLVSVVGVVPCHKCGFAGEREHRLCF